MFPFYVRSFCVYDNWGGGKKKYIKKEKFFDMHEVKGKGKAVPLQTWSGPDCSRKLRLPDFLTTARDGGKDVSLTHQPHLLAGNTGTESTPRS
jgi:hypothetical protein